jgi:hypothetical protein
MNQLKRRSLTRTHLLTVAALGAGASLMGSALPASAHASFASSAALGFAPNTAGGTGAPGAAPPYVPGSYVSIALRVPFEQTVQFQGSDDTTIDIKAIVPAGWTNPSCGAAKTQINDATTINTNQPGADVTGWTCEVIDDAGHKVLHWSGPQVKAPANATDSVQFVLFNVTVPNPATQTTYNGKSGTEGFIVDQQYASGRTVHWIPDAAYPGTIPVGAESVVASGLARTVGGAGTQFHAITPTRVLDSRTSLGGWNAPLTAGTPKSLAIAGSGLVAPTGTDAVVLNVTATAPTLASYLTVYPAGSAAPTASNLNFSADQTIANLVVVKLSSSGQIAFTVGAGSTHVVVDVVGYFNNDAGDRYNSLAPTRILDSRTQLGAWGAKLSAGSPKSLSVQGTAGISATADAVILNVTATDPTTSSFLTVFPTGTTMPTSSNVNFVAGQTIPNLVIAKVGANGSISFGVGAGSLNVVADVVGYFDSATGDYFHSLVPSRLLDSRSTTGGWNSTALSAGPAKALTVRGFGGVRADATSVLTNVTVTEPTASGFVTVAPNGAAASATSNLNYTSGETIPNLVAVGVGSAGAIAIGTSAGSTHVVADIVGYFAHI